MEKPKNSSQNGLPKRGQAHFAAQTPQKEPVPDGSGIRSNVDIAVLKRLTLLIAAIVGTAANTAGAQSPVRVQLFPFTNEVRIQNRDAMAFSFALYSLTSPSGALNGSNGVWTSIADTYDSPLIGPTPGNGFIDPVSNWIELSASATALTEGVFLGPGGSLPGYRAVRLGKIWNSSLVPMPDVAAAIYLPNGQPVAVDVRPAIVGDYNEDLIVNIADYDLWRASFGSTTEFRADGNIDGVVDATDYTIWRDNLGKQWGDVDGGLAATGSMGSYFAGVPEPGGVLLAAGLGGSLCCWRLRRRREKITRLSRHATAVS